MLFLYHLPEDILYLVLSYLDCQTLNSLSQVCKNLYNFTRRDVVWKRIAKECINSGITQEGRDIFPRIPLKDRVKISQNWRRGRCRKEAVLKWKNNLLPWIQLDGGVLYLSQAADIRAYQLRTDGGGLQRKPVAVYSGHREDVCRFIMTESHLISAGVDGKIILHQKQGSISMEYSAHNQELLRDWHSLLWSCGTSENLGRGKLPAADLPWDRFPQRSRRPGCCVRVSLNTAVLRIRHFHPVLGCQGQHQKVCHGVGGASRQCPLLHPERQQSHDRQRLLLLRRGPAVGQAADTLFTDLLLVLPYQQPSLLPPFQQHPPVCHPGLCTVCTGFQRTGLTGQEIEQWGGGPSNKGLLFVKDVSGAKVYYVPDADCSHPSYVRPLNPYQLLDLDLGLL